MDAISTHTPVLKLIRSTTVLLDKLCVYGRAGKLQQVDAKQKEIIETRIK